MTAVEEQKSVANFQVKWYLEFAVADFSEKDLYNFRIRPISRGVLFFIYCDLHVELRIEHWTAVR